MALALLVEAQIMLAPTMVRQSQYFGRSLAKSVQDPKRCLKECKSATTNVSFFQAYHFLRLSKVAWVHRSTCKLEKKGPQE